MEIDNITELNQSLKAAGLHPSQVQPIRLLEGGETYPFIEAPAVRPPPDFHRYGGSEPAIIAYQKWRATQKDGWLLRLRIKLWLIPDFRRHLH